MLGVTVILLTCSYDGREFVRVGYYVNNEYDIHSDRNGSDEEGIEFLVILGAVMVRPCRIGRK
jgi:hypothetical protein